MPNPSLWSRIREARVFRLLAVYLAASWAVLQATDLFIERFGVPTWVAPTALLLLLVGLVVLLATAWVQSHPHTPTRAGAEEVPQGWELDVGDFGRSLKSGKLPHLTWARAAVGGVFAFSLLFGVAGLYVVIKDRGQSFAPGEALAEGAAPGIAVLPFHTSGPGLEVWREGVVDLVSTNIDGAAGLRAIDSRTVLARWSEQVSGDATPDLATALAVAQSAGARYALVGSATALGPVIRLTADVYDVADGRKLGQAQSEGAPDSVYMLVDRLSIAVLQTILGSRAEDLPRVDLAQATTASLPALKAYLEGEVLYRRGDFEAAIPAYRRAVEADSTFALALLRLANSYGWSETIESNLAVEAVERAARYVDRLPEREALFVRGNVALLHGTLDGIAPLREGVRKYPDDPEMWYQLADTYNHLGDQALVPQEEEEAAFDRAIALDPKMSQLYIHPIEYAFNRADSAATQALLRRYGELAAGTATNSEFQVEYALAWGDASSRAAAEAALDTLDGVGTVLGDLWHPRFLPRTAALYERVLRRPDASPGWVAWLFLTRLEQGQAGAALAALDHPRASPYATPGLLTFANRLGIPVPAERLASALAFGPADSIPANKPFFAAAYAAETGDWAAFQRAVARAEAHAAWYRDRGDSVGERFTRGMLRGMEGVAAWRRGQRDEAVTLLEVAQREATGFGYHTPVNNALRLYLGELHLEQERPEEAIRYFNSFDAESPIFSLYRGRAYEAAGRRDEARAAYELFLDAWRDADSDPAVQAKVAEARQGLARLGFRPRG
jgi:serine/threonine-protein kinase